MEENSKNIDIIAIEKLKDRNFLSPFIIELIEPVELDDSNSGLLLNLALSYKSVKLKIRTIKRSVPQLITKAISNIKNTSQVNEESIYPTLLVPYLNESVLEEVQKSKISCIDLNGNYYIVTNEIAGARLDKKNNYKETKYIKNIYGGNSSIVGRFLLSRPGIYSSVNEIYKKINSLNGSIALSTISKVLNSLKEELIIEKQPDKIQLIQPEKLLVNLAKNYKQPVPFIKLKLKLTVNKLDAVSILKKEIGQDWTFAGESSAELYTTTTSSNNFNIYSMNPKVNGFEKYIDNRFYNYILNIISKDDKYIFFNSKDNYSSEVQTYLELNRLDKRKIEIARDIKKNILSKFNVKGSYA